MCAYCCLRHEISNLFDAHSYTLEVKEYISFGETNMWRLKKKKNINLKKNPCLEGLDRLDGETTRLRKDQNKRKRNTEQKVRLNRKKK